MPLKTHTPSDPLTSPVPVIRSERAARVVRDFGLDAASVGRLKQAAPIVAAFPALDELARPGTLALVCGPSGSGKSSLLRALQSTCADDVHFLDVSLVEMPDKPLVDCFEGLSLHDSLLLLARVGLGEAWTYIRTPVELSDGQRWRLRLALAVHQAQRDEREDRGTREDLHKAPRSIAADETRPASGAAKQCAQPRATAEDVLDERGGAKGTVLIADEFAALLDRITARVVARALRRMIDATADRARPLAAIVATSHEDLIEALEPDTIVRCDFGRVQISRCCAAEIRMTNETRMTKPE